MTTYTHSDNAVKGLDELDFSKSAVLVIDELGEVKGGPLEDVLLPPTLNTAAILDVARANGIPVIYTNDAHFEGLDREIDLWGKHGIAGAPESQPSPEVAPQPGDFVIEKPKYSAFFQTRLRSLLDDLGVNVLILTGFDTNICVQHTAADAYFNNYDIVLVDDATATFLVGTQQGGLDYMQKCYAATIASTDEIVERLAQ